MGEEQVRALEDLFRTATTELGEVWSVALNAVCTLELESIVLSDLASLAELEPSRSSLTLSALAPLPGQLLAVVPVELGIVAIDLMLGGPGRPGGDDRLLSEIDAHLLAALVVPTLDSLSDTLADSLELTATPRVVAQPPTTDVGTLELDRFDRSSAVVRFTATCGDHDASWLIVMTGSLATAMSGTHPAPATAVADETASFRAAVERRLVDVPLDAIVEFPPVRMRSTDLIALRVDDVVPLGCPVNGWLRLVVDGETVANARAARSGDHLACQIVATHSHPAAPDVTTPTLTTEFSPAGIRPVGERQGAS